MLAGAAVVGAGGTAWILLSRRRGSRAGREIVRRGSATVLASADELYRLWRDPEQRARLGAQPAPEFLEDDPPHRLSWRPARRHSPLVAECHLQLNPATRLETEPEATEVRLQTKLSLPAGAVPPGISVKLLRAAAAHLARQQAVHLFRMKQLAETGEIATTAGQSSARRSAVIRALQPFDRPASLPQRLRGVG